MQTVNVLTTELQLRVEGSNNLLSQVDKCLGFRLVDQEIRNVFTVNSGLRNIINMHVLFNAPVIVPVPILSWQIVPINEEEDNQFLPHLPPPFFAITLFATFIPFFFHFLSTTSTQKRPYIDTSVRHSLFVICEKIPIVNKPCYGFRRHLDEQANRDKLHCYIPRLSLNQTGLPLVDSWSRGLD